MLPNIVFIFAMLGIVIIILRHLPEAVKAEQAQVSVEQKLTEKGLPARAVSSARATLKLWLRKLWNFVLEAKDLRPHSVAGYKIRKIFGSQHAPTQSLSQVPAASHPIQTATESTHKQFAAATQPKPSEQDHLEAIKQDPKNLYNYFLLAKFYADSSSFQDAVDVLEYLTKHDPTNAEYYAKLAACQYKLGRFAEASSHYKTSIGLDSTQPNRYYNLGVSLEAEGKFEEAAATLEQAIKMEPKNNRFYISLSNVYLAVGNKDAAKEVLLKAKNNDPIDNTVLEKLKNL